MLEVLPWIAIDSKDNALATASKPAATGVTHFFTRVIASYTTAPAAPKLVQVKKGTDVIFEAYLSGATETWELGNISGDVSEAISAELAAHGGGAGNYGKIALIGHSYPG